MASVSYDVNDRVYAKVKIHLTSYGFSRHRSCRDFLSWSRKLRVTSLDNDTQFKQSSKQPYYREMRASIYLKTDDGTS